MTSSRSGETNLKIRSKMALAAASLFGLSFALPADGGMSGLSCLGVCWGVLTGLGENHDITLGGWSYYSGFVLANVLFVALFASHPGVVRANAAQVLDCDPLDAGKVLSVWLVANLFRPRRPLRPRDWSTLSGCFHLSCFLAAHRVRSQAPRPRRPIRRLRRAPLMRARSRAFH